jgi:predicted RNA binding protein YcfA (HicA-like mRNA interferase family)
MDCGKSLYIDTIPSVPDFPEVPQERAARALERLGFTVDRSKGKGVHYKVYGPKGGFTILPGHLKAKGTRSSIAKFIMAAGVDLEIFKAEL